MKLTVTGRHVAVPNAIREQIERKVRRLERPLNDSAVSAQCVITRERAAVRCELTVHVRGDHILHAVGQGSSITRAVTAAVDKMAQQAHRLSDRWKTRRRAPRAAAPGTEPGPAQARAPDQAPETPRVIRTPALAVKPMSLDDAVLALSGGDRPFLVFRHAESEQVAILYRRPDGHFGLIEPEA
jgi:ribosome hibernation promoting factor